MLHHSRSGPARAHRKRQETRRVSERNPQVRKKLSSLHLFKPKSYSKLFTHTQNFSQPSTRPYIQYIPGRVLREKRVCETHTGTLIHHSGSTSSTLLTDTVLLLLGRNPARHLHSNSLTISSEWSSPLQEHPQFLSSDFFFFCLHC